MSQRRVPPNQQLVAPERWPLVGERQAMQSDRRWELSISGLVDSARSWSLEQLRAMELEERVVDIHCVTRWSKLDVPFRGIALSRLLERAGPLTDARFISFVARSERRHSTSLPLKEALELGTFLALEAEGKPLAPDHGGPMRIVVPGKYFYKSVKWVEQIELLAEDRLGYWEADAGYHNSADPWTEQRYMAPTITKPQAARLIATRDFRGQDLRSIDASKRDLAGLNASAAMLRDADFSQTNLQSADFRNANLSNAHFREADLRQANLFDADIEGANLSGADLRQADLRVASMFGASFCDVSADGAPVAGAIIDETTQIDETKLDALTPDQKNYVRSCRSPAH